MKKRRQFSPQFKAQVALESLRGEQTMAALCRKHNLNPELPRRWRQELIEGVPSLFAHTADGSVEQARIAELERWVGQLTLELALGKKLSSLLNSLSARSGR